MRSIAILIVAGLIAASHPVAAQQESSCGVRYLSADHVYLDAGRMAGLQEGATVRIVRDGDLIAELVVEYAADHSSSCSVVQTTGEIVVGDRAWFVAVAPSPAVIPVTPDTLRSRERTFAAPAGTTARAQAPGPRLTGGVAVRWEHGQENGGTDVTSDVVTLPFRFRVRDLGHGWEIRARGSLRRIERSGGADWRAEQQWRNRFHEIALVRDDRRAAWHLAVGRIGVRSAALAGPFDGVAIDRRVVGGLRLGAFGGWTPAWENWDFSSDDQVAGMTVELDLTSSGATRFGMIAAVVGRYHQGEISRESFTMTTTWRSGFGLSLVQGAEFDFNRGWKRDSGASTVQLSSFALTGRWQANRRLAFSAGYDDREPVRTWETRDRPDSLFTDAGRRGLRGGVALSDGAGRRLDLAASVRKPTADATDTKSWSARLWLPAWPLRSIDLDLSVRGFTGPYLGGVAPMLGVTHRPGRGWYLRGRAGFYAYSDRIGDDDRTAGWLSATVDKELSRHWSALAGLRSDWGDANDLLNWTMEIRCRF